MKTAIYIENGLQQLVLQPENEFENNILRSIKERQNEVKIYSGSFESCRGGWVRRYNKQPAYFNDLMMLIKQND